MNGKKMWKVICPIEKKDGGTYWIRNGVAYSNKDDSINVYLDTLPRDGKIQLREWTEEELRERDQRRGSYQGRTSQTSLPSGAAEGLPF